MQINELLHIKIIALEDKIRELVSIRDQLKLSTKEISEKKISSDIIVKANQHLMLTTKIDQYKFCIEVLKEITGNYDN